MSTITEDSTVAELLEALRQFANRKGWQDIQLEITPDGICGISEPAYAAEAHDEFEAGELEGFVSVAGFGSVAELSEALEDEALAA